MAFNNNWISVKYGFSKIVHFFHVKLVGSDIGSGFRSAWALDWMWVRSDNIPT
jgi:hypothetical protein